MTAPYRDELAALEARYAALEAEVADRERARDEAARMLAEAKARARNEAIAADILAGGPEQRRHRNMMIGAVVAMATIAIGVAFFVMRRPSREERYEVLMNKFGAFTDQVCACVDKACADKVQDDFMKWATDLASKNPDDMGKPSPELAKRMTEITERYVKCYSKLVTSAEDPNQ